MAAREEAGVIPRISSPPPGYPVQLCFSLFHIMILWSLYLRWSLKLKIPWHKCRCIPVLTLTKLTQRGFVSLFIYFPNSDGAFARLEVSLNSRTVNFILRQAWLFICLGCLFVYFLFDTGSCYVAQVGIQLTVLLPPPHRHWDYKHVLPHLVPVTCKQCSLYRPFCSCQPLSLFN